ncbi:hypothetical protein E5358_13755 [Palleniella muris]|uniref:Uncharacterized protein n=1 Tax=Palleniella muris TaxID=3038145 RepID=A0AC61QM15_9BACT|nr:hypothetical protein [Palleniella muris]TGX80115.1 hypothetical protein E5358_13755 [Palleniella muris]
MKKILYTFIVISFVGCDLQFRKDHNSEVLPVNASLTKLSYTRLEDTTNIKDDKTGQMYLELTLTNPNEETVCLPMNKVYIDSVFTDTICKSYISVSLSGYNLNIHKQNPHPLMLRGKERCVIMLKIHDMPARHLYDIKKTIANMEFEYIKTKSDSVYCEKKIGNIKFTVDENVVVHKLPETFWQGNNYLMPY